jgi:hypothetical protein
MFPFDVFCLAFCLLLIAVATAQAADVGKVITLVPGATVTREGQKEDLRRHSPLRVSDSISTNATGRVRILFNDDSTVDLGANTILNMREFADSGAKSVFNVHLLQGVARVITGKIVEQNPGGFAVSTPEGTIGIRGTIVSVRTSNKTTTVYVENTTRAVYVNNINVPGGQKITIPGDAVRPEPISPQDRRNLGRELAFRGGSGVAAAAPEPSGDDSIPAGRSHLSVADSLIPPDTPLTDIALGTQALGDSLAAAVTPTTGHVEGTVSSAAFSNSFSGAFSFHVNLSSGAIANGSFAGNGVLSGGTYAGNFAVNLAGGTGTANATMFLMDSFGAGTVTLGGVPQPTYTFVKGGVDLRTLASGSSMTVHYGIEDSGMNSYDHSSGTGTITK